MKRSLRIMMILAMVILLGSITFAWFNNNLETDVDSSNNIKIESTGVLQVAYARTLGGDNIGESSPEANYSSHITMNIGDGGYDDITGDGIHLFVPIFDETGELKGYEKNEAVGDDAAVSKDSGGKYVYMDIYFRSDLPMDIYLLNSSKVEPIDEDDEGLVNVGDYVNYEYFKDFSGGIPSLNVNQSSYGLFSRNLIAGAARVAFAEYEYDETEGFVAPDSPSVIWVPNAKYQLTTQTNPTLLYLFNLNGDTEKTYSYLNHDRVTTTEVKRNASDKIVSQIYNSANSNKRVDNVMLDRTPSGKKEFVPCVTVGTNKVPAIWDGSGYVSAAYNEDVDGYIAASYIGAYSGYTDCAYSVGNGYYVQKIDGSYYYVHMQSGVWIAGDQPYQYNDLKDKFTTEQGIYSKCYWIDDDDFDNSLGQSFMGSTCRVAKTRKLSDNASTCYGKVHIAIWVEGTDREANIALNGGEFSVKLAFYGIIAE